MHEHTERMKRKKKSQKNYCELFKKVFLVKILNPKEYSLPHRRHCAKVLKKGVEDKDFTWDELGTSEEELENLTKQ